MSINLDINSIINLPVKGIYGFINHTKKKFILFSTKSSIPGIARHCQQIKLGTFPNKEVCQDAQDLTFVWLETTNDPILLTFGLESFVELYEGLGYTNYRRRAYKRFKAKIDYILIPVGRPPHPKPVAVVIKLFTFYKEWGIVGVWDSVPEAEEFLSSYYSSKVILPVFAINPKSVEYFKTGKLG